MNLPEIIDFDEAGHPELIDIFRGIDVGIAAIIASDPTLKPKSPVRRKRVTAATKGSKRPATRSRRKAA